MNHHLLFSSRCAVGLRRLLVAHTPTRSPVNSIVQSRSIIAMAKRKRNTVPKPSTPEPVATGPALVNSPEEARELLRRVSARKRRKVVYTEELLGEDEIDGTGEPKDDAGFESPLTELDDDPPVEEEAPKKKRTRRKKNPEPVVYDIPPVETKTSTFKGRLGYACLNTVLRAMKPEPIFCSRTLRIDTILKPEFGMDYCKELGRRNTEDLARLIEWNEQNRIRFLRVSSEMFPFASHDKYGYTLEYAEKELKAAGDLAKKYGHRLTTHPGQFTQLGSPRDVVVDAAIRDLEYHCSMFRYMGLDQDSVMIIHMGGMFGDKQATIERFKEVYRTRLTDEMRARLVLENDEMCYNADDLLPVCEELNIPIVFDYHHNWIYPSELPIPELIERINAIWHRKGIKPKQHLSSPCPGAETVMEKRKHADRCYELPPELPDDMDLMIEAKDKEQAVFHLYRIYNLHPVIHENLRPEKPAKPFPRMLKEEAAAAGTESPSTRRTRKRTKLEEAPGESPYPSTTPYTAVHRLGLRTFDRDTLLTDRWLDTLEVLETGVAEEPKDLEDTADLDEIEGTEDATAGTSTKSTKSPRKKASKRKRAKLEVEESESVKVENLTVVLPVVAVAVEEDATTEAAKPKRLRKKKCAFG
ncbi:UV-endonuclease UvdE-domain-containing protein [Cubamyces menziesii]|nr:UV-endonuclease UvdE-domain-containing protein [Cubamyces menziesii]